MAVPDDHILSLTLALRSADTARAAVEALRGRPERAAVEGLAELLLDPPSARAAGDAVEALADFDGPLPVEVLTSVLEGPHPTVRLAAARRLRRRGTRAADAVLLRVLRRDVSWPVRREALDALCDAPEPAWDALSAALDDPHWRVRHALLRVLLRLGGTEDQRRDIDRRIAEAAEAVRPGAGFRARGVRACLRRRWWNETTVPAEPPPDPAAACPFWDWDPAVLDRTMEGMGRGGLRDAVAVMPFLLGHDDQRVRDRAARTLLECGRPQHVAEAAGLLGEPRAEAHPAVREFLSRLDLDRVEAAARLLLHQPSPPAAAWAWAVDQAGPTFPPEEEAPRLTELLAGAGAPPAVMRAALARLAGRWEQADAEARLREFLGDPDDEVRTEAMRGLNARGAAVEPGVLADLMWSSDERLRAEAAIHADAGASSRSAADPSPMVRMPRAAVVDALRGDHHPHVRAAALTPERAAELMRDPTNETSWHVLARAARMMRVPLWKLTPARPWTPPAAVAIPAKPAAPRFAEPPSPRPLGRQARPVAPLGVSGHYGLPVEGFARAVEAGVNRLFWEPNYHTLTAFAASLSPADRRRVGLVVGTFEADPGRIRRDAERALRSLRVERLAVFLIFWVQSDRRVTDEVRAAVEQLRERGLAEDVGLSTHRRPLAVRALEDGWNPVMVRHSAAHRGAEADVFPRAAAVGTGLMTFSSTCYGRLLRPVAGRANPPPTAADCLRYCLAQPAVSLVWTAPSTPAQLEENLAALREPALPPDRRERLLAHGAALYAEETAFRRLVRER